MLRLTPVALFYDGFNHVQQEAAHTFIPRLLSGFELAHFTMVFVDPARRYVGTIDLRRLLRNDLRNA